MSLTEMSSSLFNTNNVLNFMCIFSIERVKTMLKVVLFNVKLLRRLNFHKKDRL